MRKNIIHSIIMTRGLSVIVQYRYFTFRNGKGSANFNLHPVSSNRIWFSSLGFIGLGNMGAPMAINLLKKDHKLAVYDIFPEAMKPLELAGAITCTNVSDVARQSDCIITMLPSNACVLDTYQQKSGILKSVKQGTTLIDCSTVDPKLSQTVAAGAQNVGAIFFDAPVSGGIMAANAASLTFIVGGKKELFPKIEKLLLNMGRKVFLCGPVGSGQTAKICNNMLTAISMIGTAEVMNLGIKLGLDSKTLMDVINACSGHCWSSEVYNPVPGTIPNIPSDKDYSIGFLTKLMAKDLNLALNSALRSGSVTPLGALAYQIYNIMMIHGYTNKDFSSVYQFFKDTNVNNRK